MSYSLVYISVANLAALGPDEEGRRTALAGLQDFSQQANRKAGIHGLLVYVFGHFVQWIEGEEAAVEGLMERIARDARHGNVRVLHRGEGPAVLDSWSMTLLSRQSNDQDISAAVDRLAQGVLPPAEAGHVPSAILRSLVKPRAPGPTDQCVGLIGQTGLWSSALVNYLGDKWNAPLHRTRLLGSLGLEREAVLEYLTLAQYPGGPLRVVHYSTDLLAAGWMQGAVVPQTVVALLYTGTSEESVLDFTRGVLQRLGPRNAGAHLLGFFGRTASRFMQPVEQLLAQAERTATLSALTLADSASVWAEIESVLVQLRPAVPVSTPVTLAPAPAPLPPARQAPAALAPAAPAPATSVAQRVLSAPTRQWLETLADAQGIEMVGLAPVGQADYWFIGTGGADVSAAGAASGALDEARLLADMLTAFGPTCPPGDEMLQLTLRLQDRFVLSRRLDGPTGGATLFMSSAPGFLNEALLLRHVQVCLENTPDPFYGGPG